MDGLRLTLTGLQRHKIPLIIVVVISHQAKEALLAHSTVLQARDEEIQALKEEVCCPVFNHTQTYRQKRCMIIGAFRRQEGHNGRVLCD